MLKVNNITYKANNKQILKGIDLEFNSGFVYSILGPNGAGKSTLLKSLVKLIKPDFGDIFVADKSLKTIKQEEISKYLAFLGQEHSSKYSLKVLDVVVMGMLSNINSVPSSKHYEKANVVIEMLGLKDLAYEDFDKLSGGEKKLILIARALVQNPPVLILDEPTNHLDFRNKHHILRFIVNFTKSNNVICIMTLHELEMAFYYSDFVILMKDGKIVAFKDKYSVFKEYDISKLYDLDIDIKIEEDFICVKPQKV
ncbi:ABC transporter ATP-binding protein [Hydrogenobaculum acidophilum]